MSAQLKSKNLKIGDNVILVDTDFRYIDIKAPRIYTEKVYRIEGNDFSTKNENSRYENIQVFAFKKKEDAKKYAIKRLKEYKKYLNKEFEIAIKSLSETTN